MEGSKAISRREVNACLKVDGELSDSFTVGNGVRQGCLMSLWLLNILMERCMREMKAKVGIIGAKLKLNGKDWSMVACLR